MRGGDGSLVTSRNGHDCARSADPARCYWRRLTYHGVATTASLAVGKAHRSRLPREPGHVEDARGLADHDGARRRRHVPTTGSEGADHESAELLSRVDCGGATNYIELWLPIATWKRCFQGLAAVDSRARSRGSLWAWRSGTATPPRPPAREATVPPGDGGMHDQPSGVERTSRPVTVMRRLGASAWSTCSTAASTGWSSMSSVGRYARPSHRSIRCETGGGGPKR